MNDNGKSGQDPEPTVGWAEVGGQHVDNPPNPTANGWALFHKDKKTGGDERYVMPALQNRHKAQFELWVRGEALKSIAEVQQLNSDMADDMMSVYQSDFTNGHYKWDDNFDGKKVKSARKSVRGALQLMYLLMRSAHPALVEDKAFEVFAANPPAALAAYRWAMGNWQPPVTDAGAKPDRIELTPEEMSELLKKREASAAAKSPPKTMDSPACA